MPPRGITLGLLAAALLGASCTRVSDATPHRQRARPDIELAPDSELIPGHVPDGATMGSLLAGQNLVPDDVEGMLASIEGIFDARRVRTGQAFRVERSDEGRARLFEYEIDPLSFLRLLPMSASPHEFTAEVVPYAVTTATATVRGAIDNETSSLFAAMSKAGETADLSVALADVFAGEVDFNSELQPGDRFQLVVDKWIRDHRVVGYGSALGRHAAEWRAKPGRHQIRARRRERGVLRRRRQVAQAVFPALAAEVRSQHLLGLLA